MPHPAFDRTDHRPWALPSARWTWRQRWCDLLFAHWPVETRALRALVPGALEIDEFDATSWVGLVPFRMEGVMRRGLPDLPYVSAFPEMNLRLYVRHRDRPGVWFVSLDATNPLAVWAARRWFHLPYFRATMSVRRRGDAIAYRSERASTAARVAFEGSYQPLGPPVDAPRGSLEHFLTERYCLYAQDPRGALWRSEVHHAPWPLQAAAASIVENTVGAAQGIPLDGPPALLHFARALDVIVYPPEPVA